MPFGPKGLRVAPGTGRAFGPFAAAAKYLGMSQTQLLKDLRGGKSLAQVAKANGKSVSGLEQALTASLKTRLDRAVASGRLSKAQEQRMLKKLGAAMAGLANGRGFQVPMAPLKPAQRPAPGSAVAPAPLWGPPPPSA